MPSPTAPGAGTAAGRPGRPDGLQLEPFRGWTFSPKRVRVDDVLCPPYDVIEAEDDAALRNRSRWNVVRLVRPVVDGAQPQPGTLTSYGAAASLLAEWTGNGTLQRDNRPALYVYEQRHRYGHQRGVIGALRLRDPEDGVIIPHEEVFPGPVADRLALMHATNAQFEPILVTSDGVDDIAAWLAEVAGTDPLLAGSPGDGTRHLLWRVDRLAQIVAVQEALSHKSALIADGHHRYATYREFQTDRRLGRAGDGPWDLGLALLVGTDPGSLTLGPIHRTVREATLPPLGPAGEVEVVALAGEIAGDAGRLLDLVARAAGGTGEPAGVTARSRDATVELVATDGRRAVRLRCRRAGVSDRDRIAAVVMSEVVLPQVFGVWEGDPTVEYHHDAEHAVRAALGGGVALLLPPPSLQDVRDLAARGITMPRKSTSFGPKPRSGLVLRTLDRG